MKTSRILQHGFRWIIPLSICVLLFSNWGTPEQQLPRTLLHEIYIVPVLGHLDYGFTATQREVKAQWPDIYRKGIKFLEDYPYARLTSDCLLPLEWFHETATEDEWNRFQQLVKSGRWELTAALLHANTSVLTQAEAPRLFFDSRRWSETLKIPIHNWLHADVPGLTWNMAETATDAGIRFIAVGANEMNGFSPLPPSLLPLFYWEAPDGERVLVSLRGGSGYMEGGLDLALHVREGLEDRLATFEQKLRDKNYPLDKALVLFSSGDNNGPDVFPTLMKTVEQWNAEGHIPKLRIVTLNEYYSDLTAEELSRVPVVRGDWPASATWEALVRRSPHAESAAREAKRKLLAAELLTIITRDKKEAGKINEAWREVLLYDEHSGAGAWPGKLTRDQAIEQNETEYQLAVDSLKYAEDSVRRSITSSFFRDLSDMQAGLPFICNTTDTNRDGLLEWTSSSGNAGNEDITYLNGSMPGWACGFMRNLKIQSAPILPKKYLNEFDLPVYFEGINANDPPFLQKEKRCCQNIQSTREIFMLPDGTFVDKLMWEPASKLPPAKNMTGFGTIFIFWHDNHAIKCILKWLREGILLSEENSLKDYDSPVRKTPIEGIIAQEKHREAILISSLDGIPFSFYPQDRNYLRWLLYLQEFPATFRDGTTGLVPNEPSAYDKPMQTLWVIKEIKGKETDYITQLRDMSQPLEAIAYSTAEQATQKEPDYTLNPFRSFSSSSPLALIEEIKWADFGNGVIIAVRNISDHNLTATIFSHSNTIASAGIADSLEFYRGYTYHGNGWVRLRLRPFEVKRIRLILRTSRSD